MFNLPLEEFYRRFFIGAGIAFGALALVAIWVIPWKYG